MGCLFGSGGGDDDCDDDDGLTTLVGWCRFPPVGELPPGDSGTVICDTDRFSVVGGLGFGPSPGRGLGLFFSWELAAWIPRIICYGSWVYWFWS